MTSNYLVNVPKLKGRENYNEWTFAAENFLVLEGMLHCIKPDFKKVIEAADDAKTKAKLILTIDSSLYVHIKDVKTSKDLWDKLKTLFDDSGFTRRISLLRNLISIRLENSSSMTSYVTQIVETGQKLSGTGFNISDEWIGSLLLAGLPDRFSPMIMAIEHSGIPITTDPIKTKLMDMETEVSEKRSDEISSAFASSQKWQHRNKNKSMVSGSGNKNIEVGNSSKTNVNVKVRCYKCKQFGHYRNQCTNNENRTSNDKKNMKKQTNAFSAVFLNGNFNKNEWYIDSGASVHLTANMNWIVNASYQQTKEIIVANNNKVQVLCSGDVNIVTETDDCLFEVSVKGVLCVPELTTNLLSVSQLIKNGNKILFTKDGCNIYNINGELVAMASLINGVYKLRLSEGMLAASVVSSNTWHRRLGHINSNYLNKMSDAVEGLSLRENAKISKSCCTVCCEGKQCRLPFTHVGARSTGTLNLIHTDLCGPMETMSIGGSKYFMLFVDDYSRMTFIYFLKNKSEALTCFKEFKAKVENQMNKKIKVLRSDNGREFCNTEFDGFFKKEGINHQRTNPYTPQQNGLCERFNRTIVEKARCLLFDANLGKDFWAEATNTAVYLQNRIVAFGLNGKTPYEIWTGTKPDISHLRIFGSTVMVHVAKEKRQKWVKKSEKYILIGYPENIKGYRIYNPRTKFVTTSRDIIIIEDKKESETVISINENKEEKEDDLNKIEGSPVSVGENIEEDKYDTLTEDSSEEYIRSDYEDACEEPGKIFAKSKSKRTIKKPERYGFTNMCIDANVCDDGLSLEEALQGPEREHWLKAVKDELQCFESNSAWEFVDTPKDGTIVKCKWVFKKSMILIIKYLIKI